MRWEDERYVKVSTKDTVDWLALGWEAQALLLLLSRKVDRFGPHRVTGEWFRPDAALLGYAATVGKAGLL